MKIATFNINGIKARLPRLLEWLQDFSPDVACLQEIKSIDENFPRLEIEEMGYQVETHGQKAFNGVAILSKQPIKDIMRGLPGDETDEQARYMEGTIAGIRIASIYLPNGNPCPGDKYDYKLRWMDRLLKHTEKLLLLEQPLVLCGDFNVCPKDEDVYDPIGWQDDALCRPESRAKFRALMNLGFTDALRHVTPVGAAYTFWDFQRGAWPKDHGLRIDHFLLSSQAADLLNDCRVDRLPRAKDKPSDHTPVWCELAA